MHKPHAIKLPVLGDIDSRQGLRDSYKRTYDYLQTYNRADYDYKDQLSNEMRELYGETSMGISVANGASTTANITVAGAQIGYPVMGGISGVPAGVLTTYQVIAPDTVQVMFQNLSGSTFNFNGKARVWVLPRELP